MDYSKLKTAQHHGKSLNRDDLEIITSWWFGIRLSFPGITNEEAMKLAIDLIITERMLISEEKLAEDPDLY
jgi:hypothetical protein